jgi:hypothetical protein
MVNRMQIASELGVHIQTILNWLKNEHYQHIFKKYEHQIKKKSKIYYKYDNKIIAELKKKREEITI